MNIEKLREAIEVCGLDGFEARDLAESDIETMDWAGDALHIEIMRAQLNDESISSDTIAIYPPNQPPVSKGYVVHDLYADKSVISQLATHPILQSLGLGTFLLEALEKRIRDRGISKATLGVEQTNPRARKLYERLGYTYFKSDVDSWEAVGSDGEAYTHYTNVDWLYKELE